MKFSISSSSWIYNRTRFLTEDTTSVAFWLKRSIKEVTREDSVFLFSYRHSSEQQCSNSTFLRSNALKYCLVCFCCTQWYANRHQNSEKRRENEQKNYRALFAEHLALNASWYRPCTTVYGTQLRDKTLDITRMSLKYCAAWDLTQCFLELCYNRKYLSIASTVSVRSKIPTLPQNKTLREIHVSSPAVVLVALLLEHDWRDRNSFVCCWILELLAQICEHLVSDCRRCTFVAAFCAIFLLWHSFHFSPGKYYP